MCVCVCSVAQSCLTLCGPIVNRPTDSSVHGVFSARILPFPTPGDLPDPGIKFASPVSPALADGFLTSSSTWEAQIK